MLNSKSASIQVIILLELRFAVRLVSESNAALL